MSRRDRPSDALAVAALVTGLLLSALLLAINHLLWRTGDALPGDPARFARAFGALIKTAALLGPLGFAFFLLQLFDLARFRHLRERRVVLRMAAIATLLALAGVAGAVFVPFADGLAATTQTGGAELAAQLASLRPAFWLHQLLSLALGALAWSAHRAPLPPPEPERGPGDRYASRWIPPVFGETPELTARQWRVLALMVGASFFNAYDGALFSLALKQIQADLAIAEADLGVLGSVIRLGVVPGFFVIATADVLGRRRILLWTIVGYTLCTGATALAPDTTTFLVFQFLARTFGVVEGVLAAVVVCEEIDAAHRGWAIGLLGALAGLGIGLAWLLFSQVDALPLGWRTLYLVGIAPLAALTWFRRSLPETRRFERQREERPASGVLRPIVALVRAYPRRFAAVSSVMFLMAFSGQAAGFFLPKFVQDAYGWSPTQFALLGAGMGVLALCATPLFGRLGDRRGRKPVAILFIAANPLTVMAVFNAGLVAALVPALVCMVLSDIGSDTNLGTFAKELFPTSHRSTADGARVVIGQLGGSLGLALESALYAWLGSHAHAISLLALAGLAVPFIVAFGYPETSGRTLEAIAPERSGAAEQEPAHADSSR